MQEIHKITSLQTVALSNELLATPLFQGMSRSDLQDIVNKFKIAVIHHKEHDIIAKADTPCDKLILLLHGTIKTATFSTDRTYELSEILSAPLQFQIERLFGRRMIFTSTILTVTPCDTITLGKRDILALYNNYDVFRLNFLNMLVMKLQTEEDRNWACAHHGLRLKIIRFITRHCSYPAGEKSLRITMNNLANELNDSRLNVSLELNKLHNEGLIILRRGKILVPALEILYSRTVE